MTDPAFTRFSVQPRAWDESARQYAAFAATTGFYQRTAEAMVRQAGLGTGMHVVDLACGTGVVTQQIVRAMGESVEVTAIDFSPEMLAEARRSVDGGKVAFRAGAAEHLTEHISRPADRVLCNAAFWHFDKERVLDQIRGALAPDGRCLIGLPVHAFRAFDSATLYRENKLLWMILEERALRGHGGRPPEGGVSRDGLAPPEAEPAAYLARHGLRIVGEETMGLDLPAREHLWFLRIPIMARSSFLFHGLSDAEAGAILDVVERQLEWIDASVPPIEWRIYTLALLQ